MKTIIIIINPYDVQKADMHMQSILFDSHCLPNVYKLRFEPNELKPAINAMEYILAGIDFEITDEYYINHLF